MSERHMVYAATNKAVTLLSVRLARENPYRLPDLVVSDAAELVHIAQEVRKAAASGKSAGPTYLRALEIARLYGARVVESGSSELEAGSVLGLRFVSGRPSRLGYVYSVS